ncbi:hypothetical protein ZWY2020_023263 [Hordeum vulgare]|nr:hypothetical protein ZWY2020_023263 [Hordeum vulgare]
MVYRRIAAQLVAAAVVLSLLLDSCAVAAHRLPPPVLLCGDAGAFEESGGRNPALKGWELELGTPARRLGQHTPMNGPPSPKPHGYSGSARPLEPPPPPASNE